MSRKLAKKEKFYRMMKKNETADNFFITFFKSKTEEEKRIGLELLKEASRICNKDKDIRSKALALLKYFYYMSHSENKFYKDLKSIKEYIKSDAEILKIINDNIIELNIIFARKAFDLNKENDEIFNLIIQVMLIIEEFNLKNNNSKEFLELLKNSLSLEEKSKKNNLNQREYHIFEQMRRLNLI